MRKWKTPEFIRRWDDEEYWLDLSDILLNYGPWLMILIVGVMVLSGAIRGCA